MEEKLSGRSKNHHVPVGERSRRMYKRGREYEVSEEVGKAAIEAKNGKIITEKRVRQSEQTDRR